MSCKLSWSPPENDGGSSVTHYILEKREADRKTWATVIADLKKTSFSVANLVPGNEYYFRVTAVNEYGSGVPKDTGSAILATNPISEPDPPKKVDVMDITKNSATVAWEPPLRDGGAKIDGYIIDYIEDGQPDEHWTPYSVVKDLSIVVVGLKEGKKYKFRVAARNPVGSSLPREVEGMFEIKEQLMAPKIIMPEHVSTKAGQKLRVEAHVAGKPAPFCKWKKGDDDVVSSSRLAVHKAQNTCVLIIKDVTRQDSGYYSLSAENSSGTVSQILRVVIMDIPGPPEPPFTISDIDADACSLSWHIPRENGGSNITNYVIEQCDVSRGDWVTVVSSVTKTSCRIGKLTPNKEYIFRVRSENRFGISDPIQSDRMIAQFPFEVPSEPKNARINKVNKDCIFVAWDRPESDGGSPITGYYIERKERNSLLWVKANDTVVPCIRFSVRSCVYPYSPSQIHSLLCCINTCRKGLLNAAGVMTIVPCTKFQYLLHSNSQKIVYINVGLTEYLKCILNLYFYFRVSFMNNQKQQKPTLTGQRFKTRKRDEKERFDPTQFQESIVQGLNQTGTDLEAVAKFLDASGGKLDYRRYAETLFDILVAGGMLAPGGTLSDDLTRTEFCVFTASEDLETMQAYAQVFNKLIRRYKYLEKGFEEEIKKLLLFLKGFTESERNKLAMLTGILLGNGTLSASIVISLYNENLELFPANKRSCEHFSKYFTDAGLKELSDFARNQQSIGARKELQKELQEQMSRGEPFKDIILYVKEEMKKTNISEQTMIGIVWTSVMSAVEWNKKEELVTEQAMKHLKQYSPLLKAFSSQGLSELTLLVKIQDYCYDNIHFMKTFQKIVVLLYKADVLSEEAILKWYTDAHIAKGKSVFLEQMKKFVEWLKNAEEESDESDTEEGD
ncbi:UNVERIFIED_CONTAM: hypothetical protein FKN15_048218 [Acipenser sinensis]